MGINPLIKLGKEFLTSNNFVRLKDNINKSDKPLNNKKTKQNKLKNSKSKEEEIDIKIESKAITQDKNKTNKNNEIVTLDNKVEFEPTDEINNAEKKKKIFSIE